MPIHGNKDLMKVIMGRIFMFNHLNICSEKPVNFIETNQIVIKAFGICGFGIGPQQESF